MSSSFFTKLTKRDFQATLEDSAKMESIEKRIISPITVQTPKKLEESSRFFKLKDISRGAWYSLHLCAARGQREALVSLMSVYIEAFTCVKCRGHMSEYLKLTPIPQTENIVSNLRRQVVLFDWSTTFHNAVSKRINKPEFSADQIKAMFEELTDLADNEGEEYAATGKCQAGCDGDGDLTKPAQATAPENDRKYPENAIGDVTFSAY